MSTRSRVIAGFVKTVAKQLHVSLQRIRGARSGQKKKKKKKMGGAFNIWKAFEVLEKM